MLSTWGLLSIVFLLICAFGGHFIPEWAGCLGGGGLVTWIIGSILYFVVGNIVEGSQSHTTLTPIQHVVEIRPDDWHMGGNPPAPRVVTTGYRAVRSSGRGTRVKVVEWLDKTNPPLADDDNRSLAEGRPADGCDKIVIWGTGLVIITVIGFAFVCGVVLGVPK